MQWNCFYFFLFLVLFRNYFQESLFCFFVIVFFFYFYDADKPLLFYVVSMKSTVPFPVDFHIHELAKSKLKLRHKFAKPTLLYVEQQPRLASRLFTSCALSAACSSTIPLSLSVSLGCSCSRFVLTTAQPDI